jgi:hypothetical protein
MNNKYFTKSTREDIYEMLKMIKSGLSLSEIGRLLHRDHTSIMYWIHKIGPTNIFVENFEPKSAILNVEIYKKEPIKVDCCKVCRKEKTDKKWKETDYCGLFCWDNENRKPRQNLYW